MRISYKAIGRNIRKARIHHGFTQETTANAIGISALHWGRLERGERRVSLDQLAQISDALNTPLIDLLWGAAPSLLTPPEEASLGTIINYLAAGCSDEACELMLNLCFVTAIHDKYPNA